MLDVDPNELKNLDEDYPDSEYFDKSMISISKSNININNVNNNNKFDNPNLYDSDDETVDSFAQRNNSRMGKRNEFSKKDLHNRNNQNNNRNKQNNLNDSLGNISNPNLLDSDE